MEGQTPKTQQQAVLTHEELRRTDRQRTIIGLQTMLKLNQSNILITPLNGPNTELAKNLVLAGANISIYDQEVINGDDFQTNFLVAYDDLGKKRGTTILARLQEMNPTAKNHEIVDNLLQKLQTDHVFFKKFTFICTSTLDFALSEKWYTLSLQLGIPYYNLVNCGKYAWSVINLGKNFTYTKKANKSIKVGIDGKAVQTSPEGGQLLVTIPPISYSDLFNENEKQARDLYRAILMLKHAQEQGWKYDPFSETQENREVAKKIVEYAVSKWGADKKILYENIVRQLGIDFCPVYSVLGSVISQEVIKVLSGDSQPGNNWFLYDSDECYGIIHRTAVQLKATTSAPKVATTTITENK